MTVIWVSADEGIRDCRDNIWKLRETMRKLKTNTQLTCLWDVCGEQAKTRHVAHAWSSCEKLKKTYDKFIVNIILGCLLLFAWIVQVFVALFSSIWCPYVTWCRWAHPRIHHTYNGRDDAALWSEDGWSASNLVLITDWICARLSRIQPRFVNRKLAASFQTAFLALLNFQLTRYNYENVKLKYHIYSGSAFNCNTLEVTK